MIKCLSVLLVSFLFLMTGCAPKVITNISKSYPASVTADKVRLYELGEAVPASAERIGNVSVVDNGVSTKCNYDQVVWLAKQETAKAGGNALALTDHRKPSLLGSSCHQIAGSMLLVSDTAAFRAAPLSKALDLEEEAEYGNRKYLEKQDFILAKQKEQLSAQQNRLDELTLKVSDMETLLEDVSAAAYDKAVEVVTDVVRTETRKEDMRMIEDTKKWVLSPERKAPKATREYAAHRLDTVLDKFLKTMQTTAARLQEKLLKPEVRQKGKEQVKEKARDSVLQLLNRLQAEQAQNKPAAQPRTQEGHSEI